ncbi:MAG: aldolase catalytic domain-containing protein [Acutalibacteraceae bacterium]|nr:aldolase catalytic domain-containing protein [Acutalibacteraceae bacterium]
MNHAMLLDCTLRDGAYLIDKKFGDTTIHGIVKGLQKTGIDIIEIGFLQDDEFGEGKTVFKNSVDAEKFVPQDKKNCEFAVLADYCRYSIENLDDYTGKSFDAVRACFFKKERYDVLEFCKQIKAKGYKLFVQPVDILGYTDTEIVEFVNLVNAIEPYCFSIVDTFGSMYVDDLQRVYSLIDHNLVSSSKIGFHSHNNMQMSSALSQEFLKMTFGKREVVVDTTISGMGRGAGNTPTELVAQYMVSKLGYNYDIDALLDIIDEYMDNIRSRCSWGYDTHYFIAGAYSAHVNNIAYLKKKNSIRYKDIRYILNKIGAVPRKRYDYDLLDNTYMEYLNSDIDDSEAIAKLKADLGNKNVVLIAPGATAKTCADKINQYVADNDAVVITVNFMYDAVKSDYMYFSNVKRYEYWKNDEKFFDIAKIITSNVTTAPQSNETVVSFTNLVKCGWEHMDNSAILLLRLLDSLGVKSIAIAGLDGYDYKASDANYVSQEMELSNVSIESLLLNEEIKEMLKDFFDTKTGTEDIKFITPSRFEYVAGGK